MKGGLRRAIGVILLFLAVFWTALRLFGGPELALLPWPVVGVTTVIGWLLMRMGAAEQRRTAEHDTGARRP